MKKIIALLICFIFLTGMAPDNSIRANDAKTALPDKAAGTVRPDYKDGEVTVDHVNVRTGPGVMFPIIKNIRINTKLHILGLINGWLVVMLPDDSVGMVSGEYVAATEPAAPVTPAAAPDVYEGSDLEAGPILPPQPGQSLTDSGKLLELINDYRANFELTPYKDDGKLDEIASLKAADMVGNNYFNHNSPEYGTPFTMLKNMGVFYKTASENLACMTDVNEAFTKMTGNLACRTNLVSQRYTNIGIGIEEDINEPGKKIFVLLFTEQ